MGKNPNRHPQEARDRIYELRYETDPPVTFRQIHNEIPEIPIGTMFRIAREEYRKRNDDAPLPTKKTLPRAAAKTVPKKIRNRTDLKGDPAETAEFTQTGPQTATAIVVGTRAKTLEDLLRIAKVNLGVWDVFKWKANMWEQAQRNPEDPYSPIIIPIHQIRADLTLRQDIDYSLKISKMREELRTASPTFRPPKNLAKRQPGSKALELSIPDLHFGRLTWGEEVNDRGYNPETARRVFLDAIEALMALCPITDIELFILPIGNDLFNSDNMQRTTTRGTPSSTGGSHRQLYRLVRQMVQEAIDMLAAHAPVVVPIIPGNHDMETIYFLGEALSDWYHNTPDVTIMSGPTLRKYFTYGRNLIGWTHGNEERPTDLPLIMAQESGKDWATATWREWHIGHLHRKRETKFLSVNEVGGVRIRIIPSLASIDNWHYKKGYVTGLKAAEGYLWDRERGPVAIYNYTPDIAL